MFLKHVRIYPHKNPKKSLKFAFVFLGGGEFKGQDFTGDKESSIYFIYRGIYFSSVILSGTPSANSLVPVLVIHCLSFAYHKYKTEPL